MIGAVYKGVLHLWLMARWNMKDEWAAWELAKQFYKDYQNDGPQWRKIHRAHRCGFTWNDWRMDRLTKESQKNYLKSAHYYAMHPINGVYSKWIDDKLTLKYLCGSDSGLDRYMPRYYFQIDQNGKILCLPDYYREKSGGEHMAQSKLS